MYNCQECGQTQRPRIVAYKKILETRLKTYPNRTKGFEIIKEITVCPECYEEDMDWKLKLSDAWMEINNG